MRRDGAAVPAISKLEDLVQGIEDIFLRLLALPAVDESSNLLDQGRVAKSVKAASGWCPQVANLRVKS